MTESRSGDVILYSCLWAREHERGEESGRKARPTCVMLIVADRYGKPKPLGQFSRKFRSRIAADAAAAIRASATRSVPRR